MKGCSRQPAGAGGALALLQKQEQIKGPEKASIARFQGLCCYQRSSEKNDAFRGVGDGKQKRAQVLNPC